jgi:hypothetical protein
MDRLAEVCERVASHGSRLRKVKLVADYLQPLSDDDLVRAVNFLCAQPIVHSPTNKTLFGKDDPRTLSIGYAALREAYKAVTGWDDWVLGRCHEEVGDTGETIALLLPGHTRNLPLSLETAESNLPANLPLAQSGGEDRNPQAHAVLVSPAGHQVFHQGDHRRSAHRIANENGGGGGCRCSGRIACIRARRE